ncbi:MAG TPA: substrate-binding domain-containing protein, partial [Syntrophales bacterium]|nr:substrate-binding domain-containing protein [Syntrophales bacterium]
WLFPKTLIDEWIETNAKQGVKEARQKSRQIEGGLLASGSNDLILDMLQTYIKKRHPDFYIFSANTGSTEGLKALNMGLTDIAWSHLLDAESGKYNIPYLSAYLPNIKAVVVNLFHRELGFIAAHGNPLHISGFADLAKQGVKIVNRQKGSGTRILFDYHVDNLGLSARDISGYDTEVFTHFEVGLAVLSKEADTGIATAAVAKLLGLSFVSITCENFDMILDQSTFFTKGVETLIEVLKSRDFRKRVERLGGYDFKDSGKVLYSTT